MLIQRNENLSKWSGPALKIAFFSDLHAGSPGIDEAYIEKLVEKINAQSPDLVLIGGDLAINFIVGGRPIPIERVAGLLKKLESPLGTYAVLGNHDWWNNGPEIKSVLQKNGIKVLENEVALIERQTEQKFWLVGIGDDYTRHADIVKSFSKTNSEYPKIIFMHDPGALLQIEENFFLALAGHLHGGQVYVPGLGALVSYGKAPRSWAQGKIDFKYGSVFVSKGIGTSMLPVRFNAPPEFVILKLEDLN